MDDFKKALKRFQADVRSELADERALRPHSPVLPSSAARMYRVGLVTATHHHRLDAEELHRLTEAAFAFVQQETRVPLAVLQQAIRLDRAAWEAFDDGRDDSRELAAVETLDRRYLTTFRYA
jgi:hypothetical protein